MIEVSIITPFYNSERFLGETIESVLSQSVKNWELLIVDDCSSDHSVEIVEEFYQTDPRIKLIQLSQNSGAAVARNTAISLAKGRYIAFLDSDDNWLPHKLENQLAFMKEHNYPFTYTAYEKIDEKGLVFGSVGVPNRVSYFDLLKVCSIGCLTAMYDTQYFGKVYMPFIRKRQDLGLWLRLLKQTDYAYGINEVMGQYRVRNDSISADKKSAAFFTWRLYRDIEGLGLFTATYYFAHYAIHGVLRTNFPRLARLLGVLQ